jgi:hypothetical protein
VDSAKISSSLGKTGSTLTPTGITFSVDSEDDNFGIKRLSFFTTGFVRSSDDSEDKYFGMKRFLFFETGFVRAL